MKELKPIKLSKLQDILDNLKRKSNNMGIIDPDITFEFLSTTIFPHAAKNFTELLENEKARAFVEGENSMRKQMLESARVKGNEN